MTSTASLLVPIPADRLAATLDNHDDYRVLRRIRPMRRNAPPAARSEMLVGCAIDVETTGLDLETTAIDVETTGLDHESDVIVELALQRFWADARGQILVTGRRHTWLEDPHRPLSAEIVKLTGLSNQMLAGRSIMEPVAASLIKDADFVVAHNSAFDRPFVEARLPFCAGKPWICSLRDVDWSEAGFDGGKLGHLLMQMGWFIDDAHRAQNDVTALLHLLDHPLRDGKTVLAAAVEKASMPTYVVKAIGAPFEARQCLKARGYRWDSGAKTWWREVPDGQREEEVAWAKTAIYRGAGEPDVRRITWRERYQARR